MHSAVEPPLEPYDADDSDSDAATEVNEQKRAAAFVINASGRRPFDRGEIIMAAVVALYALTCTEIGLLVAVNGVVYHAAAAAHSPRARVLAKLDALANLVMGMYVNATTTLQPQTFIASVFISTIWTINNSLIVHSAAVHVLLVQVPVLVFLMYERPSGVCIGLFFRCEH